MSLKSKLLKGTLILTFANVLTRIMGFFYRIFLSRIFSSEEIGLYQLVFPIYTLGIALSSSGIQSSLSRCVARFHAQINKDKAVIALKTALSISLTLSFIFLIVVQQNVTAIANSVLGDPRCSILLLITVYALPFAVIHSTICGYYMGMKHTKTIALSQILEQSARISFILVVYYVINPQTFSISIAATGLVVGECVACIFTLIQCKKELFRHKIVKNNLISTTKDLLTQSIPLTTNRVLINVIQSLETISIPLNLQIYGFSNEKALSTYGIYTGMALPCILFPSAITNALSAMLIPTIAEFQVTKKKKDLWSYICSITLSCFLLGTLCFFMFYFLGNFIGALLFHNIEAGTYIVSLSFLCPFLYLNTTLISILNGLGNTFSSFFINVISLIVRIMFVYFFIPVYGMPGYMFGLFFSQLITSCISFLRIKHLLSQQ